MSVCLACYGERMAALLESATELRFYSVERGVPTPQGAIPTPKTSVLAVGDILVSMGATVLICGGLSGCALAALQQSGVSVVPWIGGTVVDVAAAWAAGGSQAMIPLRMPGCGLGNCRGPRQGCPRKGRRKALSTPTKETKVE
jgi:predicted Fe-Mo cluster-binding NifX family protein